MWTLQIETEKQRGDMTCLDQLDPRMLLFSLEKKKKTLLFYKHDVILVTGKLSKALKCNEERKSAQHFTLLCSLTN